ncbi:hydrogenase maturation peptidase HycI [Franconibacter helveticus]|uniref:hydrogenase maturation peptidase HycI n=1 Tax=Franconibacter helveticus TaxID=357240 RepID=UPI00291284C8|nr:hydrogenase maturation peptidase HycI [Franconibacter helveticus]MDU6926877.1 hydrogenase maturation peptidase HycI [Franconibacter helveticus]
MTDVLLCVGNSMMGDDGAGPLLTEKFRAAPQGDWVLVDGGSAPENDIGAIRALRPARLLIVDATDMGLNPGDIRLIDPDDIAQMFMMTTHNMPLNYLVDQLKDAVGEVLFLGIQPDIVGFYYPMTEAVKRSVESVYQRLAGWRGNGGFARLDEE